MIPEIPTKPCPPEGGRYETRDGWTARVLATDLPGRFPIAVAVLRDGWIVYSYDAASFRDEMRPVKRKPREWWIVFNRRGQWLSAAVSREEVSKVCSKDDEIVHFREVMEE